MKFELYVYPNGRPDEKSLKFLNAAILLRAAADELERAAVDQEPDREIERDGAGIAHLKVVHL